MAASPRARAFVRQYGYRPLSKKLQEAGFPFVSEGSLRESFAGRARSNLNTPANRQRRADVEAFLSSPANRKAVREASGVGFSSQSSALSAPNDKTRFGYPHGSVSVGHFQTPGDGPADRKWRIVPIEAIRNLLERGFRRYGTKTLRVIFYGRSMYNPGASSAMGGGRIGSDALFVGDLALEFDEAVIQLPATWATTTQIKTGLILAESELAASAQEVQRLRFLNPARATSAEDRRRILAARQEEKDKTSAHFARLVTAEGWTHIYGAALAPAKGWAPK